MKFTFFASLPAAALTLLTLYSGRNHAGDPSDIFLHLAMFASWMFSGLLVVAYRSYRILREARKAWASRAAASGARVSRSSKSLAGAGSGASPVEVASQLSSPVHSHPA